MVYAIFTRTWSFLPMVQVRGLFVVRKEGLYANSISLRHQTAWSSLARDGGQIWTTLRHLLSSLELVFVISLIPKIWYIPIVLFVTPARSVTFCIVLPSVVFLERNCILCIPKLQ